MQKVRRKKILIGHLTRNTVSPCNNSQEIVLTNAETLTNNVVPDNYDDKEEHVNSGSESVSGVDKTEVLEKLISEFLANDEDKNERADESEVHDDNFEEYIAEFFLPVGSTTQSGRFVKPRASLQHYRHIIFSYLHQWSFRPYFSFTC